LPVTWVVPLALGGFAVLLMAVFTMVSARKRHHMAVAPAQVVGPRILVHDINDDRCTGCDACVAVCPTNVLDLVANKSRVLRFQDCIQCEACMFACPTEALVMYPEGALPPPLKIPEVDDNFQTVVPGQYLIGEVAGKPLVKNAANLGRAVVEHALASGLSPGAIGRSDTIVDVAIIGSGPGGLSAALACIQRGLSYIVLEKEQMIASTIARYPKGKLVMAEPYDTVNYSFLPVFDSSKEQLIPIWQELIQRVGLQVRLGESVETVARAPDGAFEIRSTVAMYRAQRVVLSIGTRGKPRTLQVPGENLPKVYSLLEDPDEWRGKAVLVVGGGDSACEAALALADAGAKVMISYRGKGFSRAQPRNKSAIERYAAEGRIKAKLGSQVLAFDNESVTIALGDGSQKRYPNDGAFVLIGADPPIAWLEKMGVRFVERPHSHQMGKTDDVLRRYVQRASECPEDAARAAAQVLGGSVGVAPQKLPAAAAAMQLPMGEPVSGPRKWLRSATSIFQAAGRVLTPPGGVIGRAPQKPKKFDAPVPLSEFAKRKKTAGNPLLHSGHGRRDALSAGERTRILRMLRDEGGRLADEESQVYIGAAPANRDYDFDFDDSPAPAPAPSPPKAASVLRPDVPAKPAVVVGLAQAQQRSKKPSKSKRDVPPPIAGGGPPFSPPVPPPAPIAGGGPPFSPPAPGRTMAPVELPPGELDLDIPIASSPPPPKLMPAAPATQAPLHLDEPKPVRPQHTSRSPKPRKAVPPPFDHEPTRPVDEQLLAQLRALPEAPSKAPLPPPSQLPMPGMPPPPPPVARAKPSVQFNDEPTRLAPDPRVYDKPGTLDEPIERATVPVLPDMLVDAHEESTALANVEALTAMERARATPPGNLPQDERTRAVNIRNDPSMSEIDWDLD
jgi:thioredoxin reductase/ferredoxin